MGPSRRRHRRSLSVPTGRPTQPRTPLTVCGAVSISRTGRGVVLHPDVTEPIVIPAEYLNTALPGDEVEVALLPRKKRDHSLRGEVVRVLQRARTRFVGVARRRGSVWEVVPTDPRVRTTFLITEGPPPREGHTVVVTLLGWNDPREEAQARVEEDLGPAGSHETEMRAILVGHQFDYRFPDKVLAEAATIAAQAPAIFERASQGRRDFRAVPTFTIDPEDAKDFDDALSLRPLEEGWWEVGVHIADVTAYVAEGSAIDREAARRGTSVYLVDRTIPMLPPELSEDLCSLTPGHDKLAFSVVFEMDQRGAVRTSWFGPTLIRSNHRFSYREAQSVLDHGDGPFHDELSVLMGMARALRSQRLQKGGLEIESDEVRVTLDAAGRPQHIERAPHYETHHLIEEFMLLANRTIAEAMSKRLHALPSPQRIFVYRVHDEPPEEKLSRLEALLRALGYSLRRSAEGEVDTRELSRVLRAARSTPAADLVRLATIRSMAKALYSLSNRGHYGLAFTHYTHFTSPIRRYPDVMVHRIVKAHLAGSPPPASAYERYAHDALRASQQEIAAIEAERESVRLKQVEYLSNRIGEEFEGVIVGIAEWGFYVEERQTMAEGLVRFSTLTDDHYELDPHGFSARGRLTRRVFRVGDPVRVRLIRADPTKREIEWELLNEQPAPVPSRA